MPRSCRRFSRGLDAGTREKLSNTSVSCDPLPVRALCSRVCLLENWKTENRKYERLMIFARVVHQCWRHDEDGRNQEQLHYQDRLYWNHTPRATLRSQICPNFAPLLCAPPGTENGDRLHPLQQASMAAMFTLSSCQVGNATSNICLQHDGRIFCSALKLGATPDHVLALQLRR